MLEDVLVSVIVPIYNVEPYIERCVTSIVNQNYSNLEIILINDGSTDNSLEKCLTWRKRDERIIVVDKKNDGLGPVRNYGIRIARGEYIVSVDSDDWIDEQYVEKLLYAAVKHDADVAICNVYSYAEETGKCGIGRHATTNRIIQSSNEKIRYLQEFPLCSFFGKAYRRELLINNKILQPNTKAQDLAVFVQIIACANRIVEVEDALYYYWVDRKTSITNQSSKAKDIIKVVEHSISEMKRLKLFEEYKEGQLTVLASHAFIELSRHRTEENYIELEATYHEMFDRVFPEWRKKVGMKWMVLGSFNAAWTAQSYSHSYVCTPLHYPFSSLISQFLGKQRQHCSVAHSNKFRERAVKADINGMCWAVELQEEVGILIDFMEERNDILETEEGILISDSEAFRECKKDEFKIARVINSGSVEFMSLWKEACLKFVLWLENYHAQAPIYLLKMRMAKGHGFGQINELFENQEEITKVNYMLNEMELFFLEHCKAAVYVQGEDNLYYSQTSQIYGCKPYHLNWNLYRDLSNKMSNER